MISDIGDHVIHCQFSDHNDIFHLSEVKMVSQFLEIFLTSDFIGILEEKERMKYMYLKENQKPE